MNTTHLPGAEYAPDFSHGLAELADLINFRVGAWHDFGYQTPPTPDCATIPPLGERSARAITAGHEAIEAIDELTRQLHALRGQLVGELRQDSDIRAARADAMLAGDRGWPVTPQMRCARCGKPIVRCDSQPSHVGCGSGFGWIHLEPSWGHSCRPGSGAPYARPAEAGQ